MALPDHFVLLPAQETVLWVHFPGLEAIPRVPGNLGRYALMPDRNDTCTVWRCRYMVQRGAVQRGMPVTGPTGTSHKTTPGSRNGSQTLIKLGLNWGLVMRPGSKVLWAPP